MLCKDLALETPGVRFTEGSRFLRDNVSTFEAELAARYRRAGLVILGKTNTPEFGMAPTCEPVLFGPTRNPWDTRPLDERVEWRLGGGGRGRARSGRARQRPGRLDPLPRIGVRPVRAEADPGPQPARRRVTATSRAAWRASTC